MATVAFGSPSAVTFPVTCSVDFPKKKKEKDKDGDKEDVARR